MRTPEDTLRSLRRWFGILLPEPWDVQYQRDEATTRPSAFVQPATPQSNTGSAYVRDVSRSYDAFLYPEGFEGEPARSRAEAEQLAHLVDAAMTQGLRLPEGGYYSRSMRLPVYDYAGVDWDYALPSDAVPYDQYPVDQWSVEARIDPDDDTLFTVVVSARIRWRMAGDTAHHEGRPLQDVLTRYA